MCVNVSFGVCNLPRSAKIINFTHSNTKHTYFLMADNRKEVERAELHRTIWAIADEVLVKIAEINGLVVKDEEVE